MEKIKAGHIRVAIILVEVLIITSLAYGGWAMA